MFLLVDFPEMEVITSVMFEDEETITASKGLWLFSQNVELTSDDCMFGKCGFFNSTAESKLELAYFSNAMDRFEQFSVRLFFKRSAGVSGEMSLVDNSECSLDGSVVGQSGATDVSGYFANENGTKAEIDNLAVSTKQIQLYLISKCFSVVPIVLNIYLIQNGIHVGGMLTSMCEMSNIGIPFRIHAK